MKPYQAENGVNIQRLWVYFMLPSSDVNVVSDQAVRIAQKTSAQDLVYSSLS